jgi:cytochrome c553
MSVRTTSWRAALIGLLAFFIPAALNAQDIEAKAAICAACHGAAGKPINSTIPAIWGQNEGYLYLELRDYKLGNRANPVMGAITANLERQDLRDLAAYFAAKPWPRLNQPQAGSDAVARAEAANNGLVCTSCHLSNWQGDSAIPHIGGQNLDYLRATLTAFRNGSRANNPGMTSMLNTVTEGDIEALAQYLAGM